MNTMSRAEVEELIRQLAGGASPGIDEILVFSQEAGWHFEAGGETYEPLPEITSFAIKFTNEGSLWVSGTITRGLSIRVLSNDTAFPTSALVTAEAIHETDSDGYFNFKLDDSTWEVGDTAWVSAIAYEAADASGDASEDLFKEKKLFLALNHPTLVIESEAQSTDDGVTFAGTTYVYDGFFESYFPSGNASWTTVWENSNPSLYVDQTYGYVGFSSTTISNKWNSGYKILASVDVSSLDDEIELEIGTKISLTPLEIIDDYTQSLVMVAVDPNDPESFVAVDFEEYETAQYATPVALGDMSVNTEFDFVLNTAGRAALLAAIKAETPFVFGLILTATWTDTAPSWVSNKKSWVQIALSAHATAAKRPQVVVSADIPTATITLRHTDPSNITTKIQKRVRRGTETWPSSWTDHLTKPVDTGVLDGTGEPIEIVIYPSPDSFVQARLVYEVEDSNNPGSQLIYYASPITSTGLNTGSFPVLSVIAVMDGYYVTSCQVQGNENVKAIRLDFDSGIAPSFPDREAVRLITARSGNSFTAKDIRELFQKSNLDGATTQLPVLAQGETAKFSVLGYNEFPVTGSAIETQKLYTSQVSRIGTPGGADPTIDDAELWVADGGEPGDGGDGDITYDLEWSTSNVVDVTHEIVVEFYSLLDIDRTYGTDTEGSPNSTETMQVVIEDAGGMGLLATYTADLTLRVAATEEVLYTYSATYIFDQPGTPQSPSVVARTDTGSSADDHYVTLATDPTSTKDEHNGYQVLISLTTIPDDPTPGVDGTDIGTTPLTMAAFDVDAYTLISAGSNDQVFMRCRGSNDVTYGNWSALASGYTHLGSPANFQAQRDVDGCNEVVPEDWYDLSWSNDNDDGDSRENCTFKIDYSTVAEPDYTDNADWTEIEAAYTAGLTSYAWTSTGVAANTVTGFRITYEGETPTITCSVDTSLGIPCPE